MPRAVAFLTLVLALPLAAPAADARVPVRLGGNLAVGFPVGEFRDNIDEKGVGLEGYATFGVPRVPFQAGASLSFMSLGTVSSLQPLVYPYLVEVTTRNNVLSGHGFLRLQQAVADFQPYLDGLVGFSRFFTTSELGTGASVFNSVTEIDNWTFSYGVGAGAMFEVFEYTTEGGTNFSISIEMGARYLIGGKAEYIEVDSGRIVDGVAVFDVKSSKTDMVTARFGASVLF